MLAHRGNGHLAKVSARSNEQPSPAVTVVARSLLTSSAQWECECPRSPAVAETTCTVCTVDRVRVSVARARHFNRCKLDVVHSPKLPAACWAPSYYGTHLSYFLITSSPKLSQASSGRAPDPQGRGSRHHHHLRLLRIIITDLGPARQPSSAAM